jgi:outer membrane protein TolC
MTSFRRTVCRCIIAALTIMLLAASQAQPTVTPSPVPLSPIAPPTAPLTVDDAVALALRNNPAITLGVQNVQIAQDQLASARSGRLPTVGVSGSFSYTPAGITSGSGPSATTGYFFSSGAALATQPISPASRWRAPIQFANANVGVNQEALLRTQQQVVFQTRQAFYQYLSAQELLQASQYAVTVAQTQLDIANATFNAGTAPRLDVEQAKATLANAEVALFGAQNGLDVAQAGLATQLGFPAGTPVTIRPPAGLPTVPDKVEPLVALALTLRPELLQLNFRREQLRANIALTRVELQPLLNAQAQYNKTFLGGSLQGPDGLGLSLQLSYNLFNGGKQRADVAAAKTQLLQVDTLARQLEIGVTFDVRQAWLNLLNALKQLSAADQQRVAADEALRISQVRYRSGEGILLEVEQAELRSTQARTSQTQARFQAQVAAAQLDFAIGAPPTPTPTVK